uniref:Large ribosomal subunit protein uL4m n=1 Tax=Nephromyces sp. ex Molgula occidentalis TaxID=2544991 RepID=A0A5C1H8K0_9APIC|nr:50S ribosomal protein L4 [Nephromyces sp. ex Molgula occidentalis]
MSNFKILNNKCLLFFPIRYFNNWIQFIKGTFIFKIKLNIQNYLYYNKIFISNIIHKEIFLFKKKKKASIKHRGEISYTNKKPFLQKGTGRARAGSFKSPIYKGGGIIFGPKPNLFKFKINLKILKISKILLFFNKKNNILIIKFWNKFPFINYNLNSHIKIQLLNLGINLNSKILFINATSYNLNYYFNLFNIKIINIFKLLNYDLLFNDYIFIFI